MTPLKEKRLAPREVLRVMDAAQVIHERQAALQSHETFDRDAAIRDIQIMYEELGDLVDRHVIERALDEYLSQRYAFTPVPPGLKTRLALLYVRRGWVARRVLVPAGGVAALVWAGFVGVEMLQRQALAREVETVRVEVAAVRAAYEESVDDLEVLTARGTPPDLPPAETDAFAAHLAEAGRLLGTVAAVLDPIRDAAARDDLVDGSLDDLRAEAEGTRGNLQRVRAEIGAAGGRVERHDRLAAYGSDVARLHAAVLADAVEDVARDRAAELQRDADVQLAARDADGLGETRRRLEDLHALIVAEFEIVVTGGVWRRLDSDPDVRNDYLVVEARTAGGLRVPVTITSEEYGTTDQVFEWGERVPREVYDRVGADKQDNGIIDDEHFGFKRRGFVTAERRYEDIGQITEW